MKKLMILAIVALGMTSCTDAGFEKLTNYGNSASVTCYSGGKSTGKVASESSSDGY